MFFELFLILFRFVVKSVGLFFSCWLMLILEVWELVKNVLIFNVVRILLEFFLKVNLNFGLFEVNCKCLFDVNEVLIFEMIFNLLMRLESVWLLERLFNLIEIFDLCIFFVLWLWMKIVSVLFLGVKGRLIVFSIVFGLLIVLLLVSFWIFFSFCFCE